MSFTNITLFLLSLVLFAWVLKNLLSVATQNINLEAMVGDFSRRALRVGRVYKFLAWSVLALVFFLWLVHSFYLVFFEL